MATPARPEIMGNIPDSEKESQLGELNEVRLQREKIELEEQIKRMEDLASESGEQPDQETMNELRQKLAEINAQLKPKSMSAEAGK